ncbi:MAG: hypothetical protein H7A48_12610 [Akkermansiaceae bacterium]|nr:hypothetical protein [Akkermansiaceae bacterium]MCP5547390.1 hypothetical protein [Akkermansiaceae bacterium]
MFGKTLKFLEVAGILWMAVPSAHALTLNNESATYSTLPGTAVTMSGHSELHITGAADPISGSTINLTSEDSWVFFHHPTVVPSYTRTTLLPRILVNGVAANSATNVVIANYDNGSVVIPHPSGFKPLTVYTGTHFTGLSWQPDKLTIWNNIGSFNDKIRSFTLKRGYMATFASEPNGTGTSKVYIAQDSDLEVGLMPTGLDESISFVRVLPWQWTTKKGTCDTNPVELNARWHYNWNIWQPSQPENYEYVAIKQQPWWPGLDTGYMNWLEVTHLSGYNEPNNPVEDAYKNLSPQGSVDDAVARLPELLGTGLRVGAPAVTDGGYSWIVDFVNKAKAAGHRIDYVPVHYYRSQWNNDPAGAASQLYNFLASIHNATGLPVWVTEFNNGANWTDNAHDPTVTQNRDCIEAMINMMDGQDWIERYSVYSAVEWFRQIYYDGGGFTPMGQMYKDHVSPIAYQQEVPNSGAAAAAKFFFEGDFRDDSGNGNNPLVYGTPKIQSGTPSGDALFLDGSDDYLRLPPKIAAAGDFTFAAWVKWDGGGNWQRIFDFGTGTSNYVFLTPNSGGNLRFTIRNNGTEQQLNTSPLATGAWTHVAATLSGNTGTLYVNGAVKDTQSITINPDAIAATKCYLGKSQFAHDPLFDGLIDNVYFLNQALSPGDIGVLAGGVGGAPPAAPAGLTSIAGNGVVTLNWADNTELDLAGYSVYRSKTSGSGYSLVASGIAASEFQDASVTNGLTYYYVVKALDTFANASGNSNEAVANPRSDLLIAHYEFEGDHQDSSGLGFHGTAAGAPLWQSGPVNVAMKFDGADDLVTLPEGIANGSDITIATWVYWNGGNSWQRIFDFGTDANHNLFLTPRSASNTLRFAITQTGNPGEQRLETSQLPTGQWVHVAVVLEENVGKLYVNGAVVDTETITVNPGDFNPTVNYLGESQYANDPLFNGALDDFRVYSYALDDSAIEELFEHIAPAGAAPETLAYYRFEEGVAGADVASQADSVVDSAGADDNMSTWWSGSAPNYTATVPGPAIAQTVAANLLAAEFDGGDDLYDDPSPIGPLRTMAIGDFTVESFVRFTNLDGFNTMVGRDDTGGNTNGGQDGDPHALFYLQETDANKLRVWLTNASGNPVVVDGTTTLQINTWYHVAAVGDAAAGTLKIYLNGALEGTATGFDGLFDPAEDNIWTIGRGQWNGGLADLVDGFLDEVRISAGALTPDRFLNFNPDADGDQLKDTWELARFRNLSQTAAGDPDDDGFDNAAEEANGTVPTISDRIPQLGMSISGDRLTLTWPVNHIGWRLEHSEDLEPGSWTVLPGSEETNSYEVFMYQGGIMRGFFRLAYP